MAIKLDVGYWPVLLKNSELVSLAVMMSVSAGCVTANLGVPFEPAVHGAVVEGRPKVISYVDDAVDPAIHYCVNIDGEKVGHLFPGTFTEVDVDPGQYTVMATEWFTGKGAGKGFKNTVFFQST